MKEQLVKILSEKSGNVQAAFFGFVVKKVATCGEVDEAEVKNRCAFFSKMVWTAQKYQLSEKQINAALSNLESCFAGLRMTYGVTEAGKLTFKAERTF